VGHEWPPPMSMLGPFDELPEHRYFPHKGGTPKPTDLAGQVESTSLRGEEG